MYSRSLFIAVVFSSFVLAQTNPLTQAVTARYNSAKQNLVEAAEAMPDSDYGYQLTKEQRPFSGWIEHTAMGNYSLCSAINGQPPPEVSHAAHGLTNKADLVKALRDSFTYCDSVLKGMDDKTALLEKGGKYPVTAMISLVASLNEHYGNVVGYLRTKGVTPPSTARAQKR